MDANALIRDVDAEACGLTSSILSDFPHIVRRVEDGVHYLHWDSVSRELFELARFIPRKEDANLLQYICCTTQPDVQFKWLNGFAIPLLKANETIQIEIDGQIHVCKQNQMISLQKKVTFKQASKFVVMLKRSKEVVEKGVPVQTAQEVAASVGSKELVDAS